MAWALSTPSWLSTHVHPEWVTHKTSHCGVARVYSLLRHSTCVISFSLMSTSTTSGILALCVKQKAEAQRCWPKRHTNPLMVEARIRIRVTCSSPAPLSESISALRTGEAETLPKETPSLPLFSSLISLSFSPNTSLLILLTLLQLEAPGSTSLLKGQPLQRPSPCSADVWSLIRNRPAPAVLFRNKEQWNKQSLCTLDEDHDPQPSGTPGSCSACSPISLSE